MANDDRKKADLKAYDDRKKLRSKFNFNKALEREDDRAWTQREQETQYASQSRVGKTLGDLVFDESFPNPPDERFVDSYVRSQKKMNPKGIDTPIPQLSPVQRAAKAAERQRMKTPGMGDVKSAERREAKPKTVGSMLRGQMMKQQGKK